MIVWIQKLLDAAEVARRAAALGSARYGSGKATAGVLARGAKENEALDADPIDKPALDAIVLDAIGRNKTFEAAARPAKINPPIHSRYRPGMHYGNHLDNAVMGSRADRIRVDLSMTLFLNDPAAYDGGELSAGNAAVYPTHYYHEVKPVTRGERLACVTWMQSPARDLQRRQMLYDMAVLVDWIHAQAPGSAQFRSFNKIQLNLCRMWADD